MKTGQGTEATEDAGSSELIDRAVRMMMAEGAPKGAPVATAETVKPEGKRQRRSTGRRYGPSEKRVILADAKQGKTFEEIFAKYGVCRETVARWQRRDEDASKRLMSRDGDDEPAEVGRNEADTGADPDKQSRKDRHRGYHPHWREVLSLWRSRPGMGPAQIRGQLHRAKIKVNVATVRKIMEENGYTPPKAEIKEVRINRYEAVRPLELVHMDFKHFYINRAKVYLLLFQDDFSRFICGHRMTDSENMKAVIDVFEECVGRYGKMQSVMTDAGSAFYSWNGINRFQRLLAEEYGIDQIKAKTPRSNGKIENVNKQIEKEVLDVKRYASLGEADEAIREWVRFYNFDRTHLGLPDGLVPADRFLPGWNDGADARSRDTLNREAWTEVLRVALTRIKKPEAA